VVLLADENFIIITRVLLERESHRYPRGRTERHSKDDREHVANYSLDDVYFDVGLCSHGRIYLLKRTVTTFRESGFNSEHQQLKGMLFLGVL